MLEESSCEQYITLPINCYTIPYFNKTKEERYINYKRKHIDLSWIEVITNVNIGLDTTFYTNTYIIQDPGNLMVLVNKYNQLMGDYIPEDLELIEPRFNLGGLVLRREAKMAFEIMCCDADKDEIHLEAISTFRCFDYQNQVYHKNMTPDITLENYQAVRDKVSARAGFSEHQTGLAVDINDLEQTFEATAPGIWLAANSFKYGFILRYPKGKETITGYDYEPWHFRYLGHTLAKEVFGSKLTYDEYYIRYLAT